jgi:hypothetical protein
MTMAKTSWIDDDSHPDLDAHVGKLEHFANSLADGVIDACPTTSTRRSRSSSPSSRPIA